jgi:hypothetical protein
VTGPGVVEAPPVGVCVCGQPLPEQGPSDWACSEPCQTARLHHQTNPEYPHPREIREAAEARLAQIKAATRRHVGPPVGIPDGAEVDADDGSYVRVGGCWVPAGMWAPISPRHVQYQRAGAVWYRRWCPVCR